MKDVLPTLERWIDGGRTVSLATVIRVERSAPLPVGSTLALSDTGEIAGSVTGGCVEPAVLDEAAAVLGGGAAKVLSFGFADEESFELGLPCGGSVQILVSRLDPSVVAPLAAAIAEDRPAGLALGLDGSMRFAEPGLESAVDGDAFVHAFLPRPRLYVLGAVDHASALARVAGFLGYRVTVADPRARFVTRERFPAADELVVAWPDELLARAEIDERTAICVLTHEARFDVPALLAALATRAGYIGAMGSRRTTNERVRRLRQAGVTDEELARVHAPIGLPIGGRTPEEVAVAIAAEIVSVMRSATVSGRPDREAPAPA